MTFFLSKRHPAPYANYVAADQEIREGRVCLESRPAHVRLDVTSRCNLRCVHCLFTATRATGQDMAPEVLTRIEDEILPTVATMQYADEGEPFLFRDFDRLAATLARYRPPFSRIFTNGTLIDERAARQIVESGLVNLAVSLDGASEEVFGRLRRTRLEPIVANLSRLRDIKRELGAQNPAVTIHVVVMKDNVSELADLVRLARQVDAHEVVFDRLLEYTPEMNAQSTLAALEEVRRRLGEAVETGVSLGMPVRVAPSLPQPPAPERERIDERFYRGSLEVESTGRPLRTGRQPTLRVKVHNRSPFTWYANSCPSAHSAVGLGYHVYSRWGRLLQWDGRRTPLPDHIAPGASASVDVQVELPEQGEHFRLGLDLVNESVRWFGLERRVRVRVDPGAGNAPELIPVEGTPTERGRCQHPWKFVTLKADGRVYPCRFLTVPMGHLKQQTFGEVWNSERYQALRASILDDSYSFCKGAKCPFAGAPENMFRAQVEMVGAAPIAITRQVARLRMAVTNQGTAAWNAAPRNGDPTRFVLTSMVYDTQGRLLAFDPQTTALPADVAPGARVELDVDLIAPKYPGNYIVGFEMNRAHVFRFTTLGSAPCEFPLKVTRPQAQGGAAASS